MKTIGLLGGMSWESSAEYYRVVNREVQDRLGGSHSAKTVMVSVDFHEIETFQQAGDWDAATEMLRAAARQIESAGADLMLICTNTMHLMFDEVQAAVEIPLLHIADATATAIAGKSLEKSTTALYQPSPRAALGTIEAFAATWVTPADETSTRTRSSAALVGVSVEVSIPP